MRYAYYTPEELRSYPVALLTPTIRTQEISDTYLMTDKLASKDTLVLDLHIKGKKTPVSEIKQYIEEELVPTLDDMGVEYVLCAQGDYFKALTKVSKVDPNMGYVLDSPYGAWKVIYIPNYRSVFYDPDRVKIQIDQALTALYNHRNGAYEVVGANIIKFAEYPRTVEEISAWLDKLIEMDCPLTIDIETFSLKHPTAGIGSITMCWNQHEGIAFAVDYVPIKGATAAPFGEQIKSEEIRALLRSFFERLQQKAVYHSISFDVYVLIYQLFMEDVLDTEGLLQGLEIMLRNWDCTKLITYLATNSCAGNDLSLKGNAQEFAGNWAQDTIENITTIPLDQLLEYNLIDGLSTWYVYNKHQPTMVADDQLEIYETVFKPAIMDIIQMQLTGLPLNMSRVKEIKEILSEIVEDASIRMQSSNLIKEFEYTLLEKLTAKKNSEWKKKSMTVAEMAEHAKTHEPTKEAITFNPNSPPQLQELLYTQLGLPVINLTDSKLPAADKDTIEDLRSHTTDPEILGFLDALKDYKAVNKILTAFIPAFENATLGPDGWHYLFGNFNLGGTLSGRLSSSDPNLQNLPSNVFMAIGQDLVDRFKNQLEQFIKKSKLSLGKLIKSCFEAPPGWIFAGLDFDSLEDKISAVTTKDPNKVKVYTDGFDGHCLRAFSYFAESMPDIDPNSVESINSIETKYPDERQESKVPTFALTYQGTWHTIVAKCGFSPEKARQIENRYKDLYQVSIKWIDDHLEEATKTGFVTAAFGLRVRTPLLKQVIRKTSKTPKEAEAEGRSAGNAMGQSWCLLNNRASSEFMGKVRKSEFRLAIRPCAHIHDAQYFLVQDDIDALQYTNTHLVKAVEWQEHPVIAHPQVKLSGKLAVYYPDWSNEIKIPNNANDDIIRKAIEDGMG